MSLLADDMISCRVNPKISTKEKLLQLIKEFSKVARYKIITQSILTMIKAERKLTVSFIIESKIIKYC